MPRKKLIRTNMYPYHITTRSNHKLWFNIPMSKVWKILLRSLKTANAKHPIELHALVCMSNHYHIVLRTPDANIDRFMFEFNRNFSLEIRLESKMVNKMLGNRYYWSIISEKLHYEQVMKYVYRNPVKAQICNLVEEYQYSTLYKNFKSEDFPCNIRSFDNYSSRERLDWINQTYSDEQYNSIKTGLIKTSFNFANIKGTRKKPIFV